VRAAQCQLAEYRLAERQLSLQGAAVLRDGDDHLEGERIAFDFGATEGRRGRAHAACSCSRCGASGSRR
jgi:lipopolysaccharide export system protein LptA